MKILVTGGTGFIGSLLTDKLIEMGHEVVVLANNVNGDKKSGATFIRGDIRDAHDIKRAFNDCELVYHLAALVDVRNFSDDDIYAINFLGAKNVFEVAKSKNAKIVFTSTAAVYGNSNIPNRETNECKPVSQYGKSKLRAEKYLKSITQEYFIARLFNVYGPAGHSFINTACKSMMNYEDMVIHGNGMQTRDYIFITDILDALLLGLTRSGLYNIGTGQDCSVMKIIEIIREITRSRPSVKFSLPQKNDIARSRADITEARKLGGEPKISVEDGIRIILEKSGWKPS